VCTCAAQLCCELTAVNRLHQLCSSLHTAHSTFVKYFFWYSFICLVLYWSHSPCIVSDFSHSALQLFTQSLQSRPTIKHSPPEDLIINKRIKIIESSLEPVPSCPIVPSDSTSQIKPYCSHKLLSNLDCLSFRPHKADNNTGVHS